MNVDLLTVLAGFSAMQESPGLAAALDRYAAADAPTTATWNAYGIPVVDPDEA